MANLKKYQLKDGTVSYMIRIYAGYDRIKKRSVIKQIRYTPTQNVDNAEQLEEARQFAEAQKFIWKKQYAEHGNCGHERSEHVIAPSPGKRYKRIYELAELYGVKEHTIRYAITHSNIKTEKVSNILFVDSQDVAEYFKSKN